LLCKIKRIFAGYMKLIDFIHNRILRREFDRFVAKRRPTIMPRLDRPIALTFILEDISKQTISDIKSIARNVFGQVHCRFVILTDEMSDSILQSDSYCEITPKNFNFLHLIKAEAKDDLDKIATSHVLINMARKNPELSDYISIMVKAQFRCCFQSGSNDRLYDLFINTPQNSSPVTNTKILHDYLEAISGTKTPTEK